MAVGSAACPSSSQASSSEKFSGAGPRLEPARPAPRPSGGAARFEDSRLGGSVAISFTRRVETPRWAVLHQRQHERLLRPLVALGEPPKNVPSRPRGTSSSIVPLRVVSLRPCVPFRSPRRPEVCSPGSASRQKVISACRVWLGTGSRVEDLEDRLQKDGHSPVPSEQPTDLLVVDLGSQW